jgi:hypothetical protein
MHSRTSWPATPEILVKAFWQARAAKNYEEMAVLWPGSGSWDWPAICQLETPPFNYVFGKASKEHPTVRESVYVPYASEAYFRSNHAYNINMLISSFATSQGQRFYIVSGNVVANGMPVQGASSESQDFGPVIERVIATPDADDQGFVFFSLQTGKSFKPPFSLSQSVFGSTWTGLAPELQQWIRTNDVDVLLYLDDQRWALRSLEMEEQPLGRPDQWEQVTADSVAAAFRRRYTAYAEKLLGGPFITATDARDRFTPCTAFRTRRNAMGMWQVAGMNTTPRGVKIRYKLVETAGAIDAGVERTPIVAARPGEYSVTLSNGAKLEVVAIARNLRNTNLWWRPDGVVLLDPPADELRFTEAIRAGENAENEFAILTRTTVPSGDPCHGPWPDYVPPQPQNRVVSVQLLRAKTYVSSPPLLWFAQPPEKLTYRFGLAAGPWAPVASFDGSSTNLQPGEGPVEFTPPQAEGGNTVLRFRHTVDRKRFSLHLVAELPTGGAAEVALWDHYKVNEDYSTNGTNEAKAVIHDVSPSQIKMYRVLKTPWLWGEIADIALRPLSIPPAHEPVSNAVPFQPTASLVRTKPPSGFGPIIERVVNSDGATENILIDFDSGRLLFPPPELNRKDRAALEAWLRKEGVDALADAGDTVRGFVGFDMIARPVTARQWDYVTGAAVAGNEFLTLGTLGSPVFLSAKGQLPETFLIKTREGGMGILQITGFTENPRGVKIRYKLVQETKTAR